MGIECLVLGAGQEVGKSCVVVTVGGKRIMFDCGMHMGCVEDPYPDFSRISPTGDFDAALSCVVITHFHLDHVGALPFFTEVCGYRGPIYMTYPTKALSPLMLEDYRKVMVDRRGEQEKFSHDHILDCMKKVIAVDIKQTIQVDKDLQIRAYYAGHVLGAAMFYAKVGESSLVYTGDYNMTPDRHLGAAQIDHLQLNLLITESTYATTIRDSKYAREREFLKVVHRCIVDGGKVLIPTFAMGRAQELCILLEDYWERMNLKVPIYFSAVHPFSRSQIDAPGPCVLFATPGMLTGGFSLEVFKHWAPSEKNLITLPGYCLAGTVGHKLMSGKGTRIHLDGNTQINVRCQIHQLSFSPHTDAKGIMDLIQFLSPCHVILVHGEKPNMEKLRGRIQTELGIRCYSPANNETLLIPTNQTVKVDASKEFLKNVSTFNFSSTHNHPHATSDIRLKDIQTSNLLWSRDERVDEGILVMKKAKRARILHENELLQTLNVQEHKIKFHYCFPVVASSLQKAVTQQCLEPCESAESSSSIKMNQGQFDKKTYSSVGRCDSLHLLRLKIKDLVNLDSVLEGSDNLALGSLQINVCENDSCPHRSKENIGILGQSIFFCCRWSFCDEQLVRRVFSAMRNLEWGMIKSDKRAA